SSPLTKFSVKLVSYDLKSSDLLFHETFKHFDSHSFHLHYPPIINFSFHRFCSLFYATDFSVAGQICLPISARIPKADIAPASPIVSASVIPNCDAEPASLRVRFRISSSDVAKLLPS